MICRHDLRRSSKHGNTTKIRCSNVAIGFGIAALLISIIPQTSCTFVAIHPLENTTTLLEPDKGVFNPDSNSPTWSPTLHVEEPSFLPSIDEIKGADQGGGGGGPIPGLPILWRPNRTAITNGTIQIGPWLIGKGQNAAEGCRPIPETKGKIRSKSIVQDPIQIDSTFKASRSMGIVSFVVGFTALLMACWNCQYEDATRRKMNINICVLYFISCIASWLMLLMFRSEICSGVHQSWNFPELEREVSIQYSECDCRSGCVLTMVNACLWMTAAICVLIKTD